MAVRLSSLHAGHLLLPKKILGTHSVRGRVDLKAIVLMRGLGKLKNAVTSLGIVPANFRLVAWCLNQLWYRKRNTFYILKFSEIIKDEIKLSFALLSVLMMVS
jgi:hypothetical protein